MKKLILIALLVAGIAHSAAAQKNSYAETVQELIRVSGSESTYRTLIPEMFALYSELSPEVPPEYWQLAEEEMVNSLLTDLIGMLVPIYERHLSQKDLEALIKFYKTSPGQNFARSQAAITSESMQAGYEWGLMIALKVETKLREDGYSTSGYYDDDEEPYDYDEEEEEELELEWEEVPE